LSLHICRTCTFMSIERLLCHMKLYCTHFYFYEHGELAYEDEWKIKCKINQQKIAKLWIQILTRTISFVISSIGWF
jgi:hypothetical protein